MLEKDNQTFYREYDLVPVTGRYRCAVCGNIEIFYKGDSFSICDNCMHGKTDDIWILIEEIETVEFGSI